MAKCRICDGVPGNKCIFCHGTGVDPGLDVCKNCGLIRDAHHYGDCPPKPRNTRFEEENPHA